MTDGHNIDIIENAVQQTIRDMEQNAPIQMQQLKQDMETFEKVVRAAREAASEQVTLAKDFAYQPSDILPCLKKRLSKKRIKMIKDGLTHPTYHLEFTRSREGHHSVSLTSNGEAFVAPRDLLSMEDIHWTRIMEYASIVVEAVMLVMSALGISPSPSSSTVENAAEEVAQVLKNSSQFYEAMGAFVDTWNSAGVNTYQKAKALFLLVNDTYAAGLLWTVIKALCSKTAWYEWLENSAKVTAIIIAAVATNGTALTAEMSLAILSAVDFARKLSNLSHLENIKSSL